MSLSGNGHRRTVALSTSATRDEVRDFLRALPPEVRKLLAAEAPAEALRMLDEAEALAVDARRVAADETRLKAGEYAEEINTDRGTPMRWVRDGKVRLGPDRKATRAAWRAADPMKGMRRERQEDEDAA